jgi:hypothetical protein
MSSSIPTIPVNAPTDAFVSTFEVRGDDPAIIDAVLADISQLVSDLSAGALHVYPISTPHECTPTPITGFVANPRLGGGRGASFDQSGEEANPYALGTGTGKGPQASPQARAEEQLANLVLAAFGKQPTRVSMPAS